MLLVIVVGDVVVDGVVVVDGGGCVGFVKITILAEDSISRWVDYDVVEGRVVGCCCVHRLIVSSN
jgi:hypothetical protein